MARRPFGGTTADVAQDTAGDRVSGAQVTLWTAATGGTQVTDVQTPAGVALAGGVVTSDSNGVIAFLGPADGTTVLYADGGMGGRTKMLATDVADRVLTLEGSAATVTGLAAETAARQAADTAEATARANADALLAPLASPAFTGNPTAPTPTAGDSDTSLATTAFVAQAVAAQSATYASRLTRRAITGAPLRVMASGAPTLTLSAASAATSITSGVLLRPENLAAFRYGGTIPKYGTGYPLGLFYSSNIYTNTSASPWWCEFDLDSALGKFEIDMRASTSLVRVLVDGQAVGAGPSFTLPGDSAIYKCAVDFGAAAKRRIRLEFSGGTSYFGGLWVGPTDGVTATPKRLRCIVAGDSFTEPTFADSGSVFTGAGFPQHLGYVTGWDVWSAGSGGTGYLNPGTGGRVKLRDRLAADVLAYSPDVLMICMGLNDRAYAGVSAAAVQAEVAAVIAQVQALATPPRLFITSQFINGGPTKQTSGLIEQRDAIKAACAAAGVAFLDLLESAAPVAYASTLASGASSSATSVSVVGSFPSRPDGATNYWIQVGTGTTAEKKFVTGLSGTGPYTLSFSASGGLQAAHSAGEPITIVGVSALTGTGRQGATAGDGNADRFVGTDTTHPTAAGHEFWGEQIAGLLGAALPAL